jgi:hypothetical protein
VEQHVEVNGAPSEAPAAAASLKPQTGQWHSPRSDARRRLTGLRSGQFQPAQPDWKAEIAERLDYDAAVLKAYQRSLAPGAPSHEQSLIRYDERPDAAVHRLAARSVRRIRARKAAMPTALRLGARGDRDERTGSGRCRCRRTTDPGTVAENQDAVTSVEG